MSSGKSCGMSIEAMKCTVLAYVVERSLELQFGNFSSLVREADPLLTVCACPDGFDHVVDLGGRKLMCYACHFASNFAASHQSWERKPLLLYMTDLTLALVTEISRRTKNSNSQTCSLAAAEGVASKAAEVLADCVLLRRRGVPAGIDEVLHHFLNHQQDGDIDSDATNSYPMPTSPGPGSDID
jgi:hypothetical protein